MKRIIILIILILLSGCNIGNYYHQPGGPYYFKSGITYQGIRPNREITKEEAKKLEENGYAYTIAYFNDYGKPTIVEKYFEGKIITRFELIYKNGKLYKQITTDENGNKKEQYINKNL
jgi:uncharacterized protein YxeA